MNLNNQKCRCSWLSHSGAWLLLLLLPPLVRAQTWVWTTETVDSSAKFTWISSDSQGNLHISYASDEGIKYAFRPAGGTKWFTMVVDRTFGFTRIAIDRDGNPHLCYTTGAIKYARLDGQRWKIEEIGQGSGVRAYSCSVAVAPDGTPHVTWYHEKNPDLTQYLHFKYAVFDGAAWLARTVDFEGQTGKWNCMVLDKEGKPYISYDSFLEGKLKFAHFDGERWIINAVDVRGARKNAGHNPGVGNSIVLGLDGQPQIAYEDTFFLYYARQRGKVWSIEKVDSISTSGSWQDYRTSTVLDRDGFPHISYEDSGLLKHAYWDGKQWRVQLIVGSGLERWRYCSIAIDPQGVLYISYRDPFDGSLKLATGHLVSAAQQVATEQSTGQRH